jgi:hypothetical protein
MAEKFEPVVVAKGGVQRVARSAAQLVAYEFDGFRQKDAAKPKAKATTKRTTTRKAAAKSPVAPTSTAAKPQS